MLIHYNEREDEDVINRIQELMVEEKIYRKNRKINVGSRGRDGCLGRVCSGVGRGIRWFDCFGARPVFLA